MLDTPLWKKISLWVLTLALAGAALPSLVEPFMASDEPVAEESTAAEGDDPLAETASTSDDEDEESSLPQVNLGLDLAGGSHLLLEADPADVDAQRLENMEEAVEAAMRQATPEIETSDMSRADGQLAFLLDSVGDIDRARGELEPLIMGDGLVREWDLEVVDGQRMVLSPTDRGRAVALNNAMEAAVEVIRKRIDSLGTREPTIIRQGDNRIVVQVPGLSDPQKLKDQLEEVAVLEFKLVDEQSTNRQAALPGSQMVPYPEGEAEGQAPLLGVKRLNGDRKSVV